MEKTFLEITHARIYARGGGAGPPLEIANLSNSPGKIPENSPFPFWKSYTVVPTHTSISSPPHPGENFLDLCMLLISDFIYIHWHQFSWIL